MKRERLGCLTPPGLIGGGLTFVVIAVFTLVKGGVLFSPGALNNQPGAMLGGYTSHARFTGECQLCHAPFWEKTGMDARCETCHTTIPTDKTEPSSLHGVIFEREPGIKCRECHPDHRGETASLTTVTDLDFPHDAFGYSLLGHSLTASGDPFTCSDCHGTDLGSFDPTTCQTCHEIIDPAYILPHIQAFGMDCLACHDGLDSYAQPINHDLFAFPLTGAHTLVSCYDCHPTAHSIAELQSTKKDCFSCHLADDLHEGTLGETCEMCHITDAWNLSIFDHTMTVFQLLGKHSLVPCESCHPDLFFAITPTDCSSCHSGDDIHAGRFGTDCSSCHEVTGWKPALFNHDLASFKLTGAHISTPCESCHLGGIYLGTPSDCYSCHSADDIHGGRYGSACQSCHTTAAWLPAYFDHNLSNFPLTGAHAGLACSACHSSGVYAGLPTSCGSCHSDPAYHAGLFGGMGCDQCHTTSSWTPASFPLSHPGGCDGSCLSHEGATCRDCHTSSLGSATCLMCHETNSPGDGGDD